MRLPVGNTEGRIYGIQCYSETNAVTLQRHLLTDGWHGISGYQACAGPEQP